MSSGRGTMNPAGRGRGRGRSTGGRGRGTMNQSEEAPIYNSTLERPIYSCKVNELRPGTMGHSLTVKVLTSTLITTASQTPLAECLVGDDTAVILFTARGSQVKLLAPGTTVLLRDARITLFRGSMRLSVDSNPRHIQLVKLPPDHDFDVRTDNNLSVIKFEVITLESLRNGQF